MWIYGGDIWVPLKKVKGEARERLILWGQRKGEWNCVTLKFLVAVKTVSWAFSAYEKFKSTLERNDNFQSLKKSKNTESRFQTRLYVLCSSCKWRVCKVWKLGMLSTTDMCLKNLQVLTSKGALSLKMQRFRNTTFLFTYVYFTTVFQLRVHYRGILFIRITDKYDMKWRGTEILKLMNNNLYYMWLCNLKCNEVNCFNAYPPNPLKIWPNTKCVMHPQSFPRVCVKLKNSVGGAGS